MLTSPEVSGGISWANTDIDKMTVKLGDFELSRPFDSIRQRDCDRDPGHDGSRNQGTIFGQAVLGHVQREG